MSKQNNNNQNRRQRISGNKIMFTLNQLKSFCEKNNVRYELNPRYTKEEYYNYTTKEWERAQTGWYFGMNNISGTKQGEYQWVWYETIGEKLDEESKFYFEERYSMAVGKSYRGINESWRAYETINRKMA